jgi:uncharacterized protein YacL
MTPARTINLLRILFLVFATVVGTVSVDQLNYSAWSGAVAGACFGLLAILADRLLKGIRLRAFSSATFGLLLGLIFAHLLRGSQVLVYVPERMAWLISLGVYCFFGYLGMMLAIRSNRDEFSLIIPYVRFRQQSVQEQPILVDTNIVIDGRIMDLCQIGFLRGPLIVPRFVLNELQRLGDSSDAIKRERGRRGLGKLQEMQLSEIVGVTIHETDNQAIGDVDSELIRLAQILGARIISNDMGLCQVARLQKVAALNLNEMAKALQMKDLPGDEIELYLSKEGRDYHQAVGYKNDGTMVVVNQARHLIGQTVEVVIGSFVQTNAGRLTFAELKNSDKLSPATGA